MKKLANYQPFSVKRWVHQNDAILNQAAPVQNTWYNVLDYTDKYTRLIDINVGVATTGETLEVELMVDGIVYLSAPISANADKTYPLIRRGHYLDNTMLANLGSAAAVYHAFLLEGSNIRVRLRKITNAGAGNLQSKVIYALMED